MSDYVHARELEAGALVFREGEPGDDAYIVESGSVEILLGAAPDYQVIATLGPGEIFGEMALIANARRSATVRCREATSLLVLRRGRLMKPIENADPLTKMLLQILTERLNEASRSLTGGTDRSPRSARHRQALEAVRDLALRRVSAERQLRRGIESGEFELHYQPVFTLSDGTIAGAEALMRWRQPENGFISPAEFIPLAEETGMIVEMGLWALGHALKDQSVFDRAVTGSSRAFISINLSAAQLATPEDVEALALAISDAGIPTERIKLELTESLLVQDPDRAAQALARLKETGVRLAIDDFGTGYSSLAYLHRFPFDTLKIDRSFICRMSGDAGARQLVRSIIDMARGLGMETIAEGIETPEEREILTHMGCDAIQGFLMARPMPATDYLGLMRTGGRPPRRQDFDKSARLAG